MTQAEHYKVMNWIQSNQILGLNSFQITFENMKILGRLDSVIPIKPNFQFIQINNLKLTSN